MQQNLITQGAALYGSPSLSGFISHYPYNCSYAMKRQSCYSLNIGVQEYPKQSKIITS
jgi:hypothetical protein